MNKLMCKCGKEFDAALDKCPHCGLDKIVKEYKHSELVDLVKQIAEEQMLPFNTVLDELKAATLKTQRKSIFPAQDGDWGDGEVESIGNSIIDTTFFSKSYQPSRMGFDVKANGMALGSQLLNLGGPFKRLSPEMEEFGKMIKCRMNIGEMQNKGIDVREYNEKIKVQLKAASGLSEGVAADGGNLVPVEYLSTIIEFATAQSMILSKVWRLPMGSLTMKIPKLTQTAGSYFGGITLYWADEAGEKLKTKPSFDQLTFTAYKLIGLIYMTDELIQDSIINLVNYITGIFVRAFQYEMENKIINGSGASQPQGIVTDSTINRIARTTANTIKFDDVVNLDCAIDENFNNLVWMTRKASMGAIRKLKDTNGDPIYKAEYLQFVGAATVPDTLLTYPIYRTRNMPAMGSDGDLVLGDLGMYIWAVRQDMTIARSDDLRFDYDETVYRFVTRQDGKPGVSIAFAMLKATAT